MRASQAILLVAVAAALGVGAFVGMARRVTEVATALPESAAIVFGDVLRSLPDSTPLLTEDADGRLRVTGSLGDAKTSLHTLHVMGYLTADGRLVRTRMPFWFFRLKRAAVAGAIRAVGFDPAILSVTPEEMERHGPGLVLDLRRPAGDRLLVWTD